MNGATSAVNDYQTTSLPIVLQDLPAAETLQQVCQALSVLETSTRSIFKNLLQRVTSHLDVLEKLIARLQNAEEKLRHLETQAEDVELTCSSRYPNVPSNIDCSSLRRGCKIATEEYQSAAKQLNEVAYLTKLHGCETAELFHFFKQALTPPIQGQQSRGQVPTGSPSTVDGLLLFNSRRSVHRSHPTDMSAAPNNRVEVERASGPLAVATVPQSHPSTFRPFTCPIMQPKTYGHTAVLATAPKLNSNMGATELPSINSVDVPNITSLPPSRASTPHKLFNRPHDVALPAPLQSTTSTDAVAFRSSTDTGSLLDASSPTLHASGTSALAADEYPATFAAPTSPPAPFLQDNNGSTYEDATRPVEDARPMPPLPPIFVPDVPTTTRPLVGARDGPGPGSSSSGPAERLDGGAPQDAPLQPRVALPSLPEQSDGKGPDSRFHASHGSTPHLRALGSLKGSSFDSNPTSTPPKDDFVNDLTRSLTHRQRSLTGNLSVNMTLMDLGHDEEDVAGVAFSRDPSNASSSYEDADYGDATGIGGLHTFIHKGGDGV